MTADKVARCVRCDHHIRHHQTYPYLDGVNCASRVNKAWCECPLTIEEAFAEYVLARKLEVLGEARQVITQYLATAEKWRYDRVCWAFAIMLNEIPEDTPEPLSPGDEAEIARRLRLADPGPDGQSKEAGAVPSEYTVTATVTRRVRAESIAGAMSQVGDRLRAAFGEENAGIEKMDARRLRSLSSPDDGSS